MYLCTPQSALGYSSSAQVSTSASARFSLVRRVTTVSVTLDVPWSLCRPLTHSRLARSHPVRVRRSRDAAWQLCANGDRALGGTHESRPTCPHDVAHPRPAGLWSDHLRRQGSGHLIPAD